MPKIFKKTPTYTVRYGWGRNYEILANLFKDGKYDGVTVDGSFDDAVKLAIRYNAALIWKEA